MTSVLSIGTVGNMSKLDLKELIEFANGNAEKIFGATGDLMPMWHAIRADGESIVVAMPDYCEDKDAGIAMIKALFELQNVETYVFVSEAWILEAKNDPDVDVKKIMRAGLANHPDRREAIAFAAENLDGEMLTARRFILRPEHGKAKLAPLIIDEMSEISQSTGRAVGLLKRVK